MARVSIVLPGRPPAPQHHRQATIVGAIGAVTLDITSPEVDIENLAASYTEVPRPGARSVLERNGRQLRRERFEATLTGGDPTGGTSVERQLDTLVALAAVDSKAILPTPAPAPVTFAYGPLERSSRITYTGTWLITDLSVRSQRRRQGDNAITRAKVMFELTEYSPPESSTPPSALSTVTPAPLPASGTTERLRGSRHVWNVGDSLFTLAQRRYGSIEGWRLIADANGITDPRSIAPGTVLVLP